MRSIILPIALAAAGCASMPAAVPIDSEAAVAPVIAAERAFAARHQEVSVKRAFLEFSAPDGVSVEAPGVKNVHDSWNARPDRNNAGFIKWWPAFAGVARSGDLGFTTGPAVFGDNAGFSTYFTIWKKQPDGSWKWLIDLGPKADKLTSGPSDPVTVVPVSLVPAIDPARAWDELRAIDTDLGQAMLADNRALLTKFAPEGRLLGRGLEPAIGSAAAAAALSGQPAAITAKPEGGGVSAAGDLGWTFGYANWKDGNAEKRGAYVRAWQRRPQGWVVLVDALNPF